MKHILRGTSKKQRIECAFAWLGILLFVAAGCTKQSTPKESTDDSEADTASSDGLEDSEQETPSNPGGDSEDESESSTPDDGSAQETDSGQTATEASTDSPMGTDTEENPASDTVTDTASPEDCCLDAQIHWVSDCAMGHMDPYFVIKSCDEDVWTNESSSCVLTLPDCPDNELVDATDFNSLLSAPDLIAAFVGDVTSFGISHLPSLSIFVTFPGDEQRQEVYVGDPCEDDESCTPIPQSLMKLKSLLVTLMENQTSYGIDLLNVCEYHL